MVGALGEGTHYSDRIAVCVEIDFRTRVFVSPVRFHPARSSAPKLCLRTKRIINVSVYDLFLLEFVTTGLDDSIGPFSSPSICI